MLKISQGNISWQVQDTSVLQAKLVLLFGGRRVNYIDIRNLLRGLCHLGDNQNFQQRIMGADCTALKLILHRNL